MHRSTADDQHSGPAPSPDRKVFRQLVGNIAFFIFGGFIIFLGYAAVQNPWAAVVLYILDHLFFSMAIAMKTYFQKIADPKDMAPTAGVSFTINHIAAVVLPAIGGVL